MVTLTTDGHALHSGSDAPADNIATADEIPPVTELRGRHISSTLALWMEDKLTSPCYGLLFSGDSSGHTTDSHCHVDKSEVRPFAMLPPLQCGRGDASADPDAGKWSASLAVRLLLTEWGLEPPRVLMTVIGDNSRLSVGAAERQSLTEGLQQVARSNIAWVLLPGESAETDRFVNDAMAGLRMPIIETAVVRKGSPQLVPMEKAGGRCVQQLTPPVHHATQFRQAHGKPGRAEPAIVSSTATHHVLLQHAAQGDVSDARTMSARLATIKFQLELADYIKLNASSVGMFGVKGSVTSIGIFIAGSPSAVQECLVAARYGLPLLIVDGVGGASEIIAHQIRTRQAATIASSDRPAAGAAEIKLTALIEDTFLELSTDASMEIRQSIDEIVDLSAQTGTISIANQADLAPALLAKILDLPEFNGTPSPARMRTPTPEPTAGAKFPQNTDGVASGSKKDSTKKDQPTPPTVVTKAHPQPPLPSPEKQAGRLSRLKRLEMAILFHVDEAQQRELGNIRILPAWGPLNKIEMGDQNDPALEPQIQMIKHCLLNTESSFVISAILNQLSENCLRDIMRSKIM